MLKVLIVDDEAPARDELKFLLASEPGVEIAGEADNGPAAVGLAASVGPNVIFLDVEMRGMNGCETAVALRQVVPEALIVFATAYDDYALNAFQIGAVDYLLKPFEEDRVKATVQRLKNYLPQEWSDAAAKVDEALTAAKVTLRKLPVEKNGKIVLISYDDISYAHTHGGSVTVITGEGEYYFGGTLGELEERLTGTHLVRVHKSFIVNMDKVQEVIPWFKGTYWLKVAGCPNMEIPVSKNLIKELKDLLGLR